MSLKQQVTTDKAPIMMPDVLSQAIIANNTVYCSGAVGIDPQTGKLVSGTVGDRTVRKNPPNPSTLPKPKTNPPHQHQCIRNLSAVLSAAGSSPAHVFKTNVFLADMQDFAAMNEAYKSHWGSGAKPARTCVAVKQLPLGTDVEIECQAVL
ncbi:hypothetical protein Q7P37_007715 [Cladosporium fusiforme]